MIDTTKEIGKTTYKTIDRYNHIRISGYMQPQFQVASEKGAATTYSGGSFSPNSDNRFMLRRGRIRFDYAKTDQANRNQLQFVFQFDGTERGVFIRDFWGRYWENKWEKLAFTTGMFARPFGFEVNLSSGDRETPERGRMSQTLMKTERDMGFMVTYEDRKKTGGGKFFRIDAGIFNGQGLTAPSEFDSYKDFIGQIVIKPQSLAKNLTLGGGVSLLEGGLIQNANYSYRIQEKGGIKSFVADSITSTAGGKLPRQYYGANAQLRYKTGWGFTELRTEYWQGTQTGTRQASETPSQIIIQPDGKYAPFYVRPFHGGFLYFLQNIVNTKHQFMLKYDWYDPNTKVKGAEIGNSQSNFGEADIKFGTIGTGYLYHFNENLKVLFYYEWVKNETTSLAGYTSDRSDNIFTLRTQFRF
ncbi:MAG TPA: hypothetical protein VK166_13890 [Chitinophagaceae bacterium]|nr:hypothetical protein [Chitinophagaceae bacterium]